MCEHGGQTFLAQEAQSVGNTLGLADDVSPSWRNAHDPPLGLGLLTRQPETSDIEKQYHAADSPYRELVAPQLNALNQFGYDLFNSTEVNKQASFDNVPVGPDYVVGPGDTLNVLLWGRI